jgi:hypothetical protein
MLVFVNVGEGAAAVRALLVKRDEMILRGVRDDNL